MILHKLQSTEDTGSMVTNALSHFLKMFPLEEMKFDLKREKENKVEIFAI